MVSARVVVGKKVEFLGKDGGREAWVTFLPADHDPDSAEPVAMSLTMFVDGETADQLTSDVTYTLQFVEDEATPTTNP